MNEKLLLADEAKYLMEQIGRKPDWQKLRGISKDEFTTALKMLKLSQAAAARYLGTSSRQVSRWVHGESRVPPPVCLLFSFMIYYNIKPDVPQRMFRGHPLDDPKETVSFP